MNIVKNALESIEARIAEGTTTALDEAAVLAEGDTALRGRIEKKRTADAPAR